MSTLSISRMVSVSTAHITSETDKLLRQESVAPTLSPLCVFGKDGNGWIIYLDRSLLATDASATTNIPSDLSGIIDICLEHDIDVIDLDDIGDYVEELPMYNRK